MAVDAGQTYRWTLDVRDASGAPANAATIALTITLPDQTTLTPTVANPPAVTGSYIYDHVTTLAGLHKFTSVTTSPGTAKTDYVNVRAYRSVLGLDEAREYLNVTDRSRDELIRSTLGAITREIERHIGTCVIRAIANEFIPGEVRDAIRLPSGPLPTDTSVTSIASVYPWGPSWATADLIVDGAGSMAYTADGTPFTGGPWRWSGTAGRAVISDDVIDGAKMALWDAWATQRGASADQLEPSLSETGDYSAGPPPGYRLPPRVLQLIGGEKIPTFA
ncbi:MAG TPA: head-tail connector protein [Streptosporangiaceae bacterium]